MLLPLPRGWVGPSLFLSPLPAVGIKAGLLLQGEHGNDAPGGVVQGTPERLHARQGVWRLLAGRKGLVELAGGGSRAQAPDRHDLVSQRQVNPRERLGNRWSNRCSLPLLRLEADSSHP